MKNFGDWIRRTCQYLLERSVNLYAPEQRSWGRAASAEVYVMPSSFSALRWTHSALWLAIRAGLVRLLRRPADAILGTNSLLRRSWPSLSPLLLGLALCFFLSPQFRQALQATTSMWLAGGPTPGLADHTFRRLQANAEKEHDAQTLAFLAFHARDRKDTIRLAGDAVAMDPGLTWVFGEIPDYGTVRVPQEWLEQLERWDATNAVPYLLRADSMEMDAQLAEKKDQVAVLAEMKSNGHFRELMRRAFAAPRYDSYLRRRLELERAVMRKHGLARPVLLLEGFQKRRRPILFHSQSYARWIIAEAKSAPRSSGMHPEDSYWQVMRFGQLMEAQSDTLFEHLGGGTLQQMGGKELIPLLRAQDKTTEANTLDYALQRVKEAQQAGINRESVLAPNYAPAYHADTFNPGIIIHIAALVFVLTSGFLAVCLVFLRVRPAAASTKDLPRAAFYAPFLLFASALSLMVAYLPYARIFQVSMFGQQMALGIPPRPASDAQLLESLSNLQYPFRFLTSWDVWATLGIAAVMMFAFAVYSIRQTRPTPA
jgi:hypothetical protein